MAPTTSFLQLGHHTVVPVRTFVNKREVEKNISETSIEPLKDDQKVKLRLSRVQRITVSNKDLSDLYTALTDKLGKVLLEYTEEELESLNKFGCDGADESKEVNPALKGDHMLKLLLETDRWRCYLVISMDDLMRIRSMAEGPVFEDTDGTYNVTYGSLLLREMDLAKREVINLDSGSEEESDEEPIDEEVDAKQGFTVKYRGRYVIPVPLNVHIYARQ